MTTSKIKWTVVKAVNLTTGQVSADIGAIVTTQKNKIECMDAAGAIRYTFPVTKTVGTWPSISSDGGVNYQIVIDGNHGNVSFKKSGGSFMVMIFIPAAAANIAYECTVSQTQIQ